MPSTGFYRAFEDKYRGSRDLIKSRLTIYLPFATIVKQIYPDALAIDLGCGRGEWLELLNEHGFITQGVDIDQGMLEACYKLNLNVQHQDALGFLKNLPNASCGIVSGFHVAEHIPFDDLRMLVEEAKRVLLPAGLLILETPNPENIVVGTSNFYMDPTHQRPLPPQLLSFISEYYGFERIKILRLNGPDHSHVEKNILNHILYDVSPDYTVLSQKSAPAATTALFDKVFNKEYGVTLQSVIAKHENLVEKILDKIENLERSMGIQKSSDRLQVIFPVLKNAKIEKGLDFYKKNGFFALIKKIAALYFPKIYNVIK